MTVPFSDLQEVAPSAVIELFELELNATQHGFSETYRFHAGTSLNANGEVVWAGNAYQRFPVEAEGFEYSGQGQLPRPKLRVSNILGTITAILLNVPDGLEGAKVTRIRTLARYIDAVNFPGGVNPYGTPDPTAEFPREIYYIDRKSVETRDLVEFELAAAFDLTGVRAPKRQCIANICQWVYRSPECSYTVAGYYDANNNPVATLAQDVCGKRLSGCEVRFNPYTREGTATAGSNVLTMASTLSILPGEPVRGWGLPAGTTVAAVTSATALQLSANSSATSIVTVNGTPSATAATMTVTSATGIAVGHQATGTYMNGATVTGVSGTTLTLSQRPYSIGPIAATLEVIRGGVYFSTISRRILISNTSGITVGMRVFGSSGIDTTVLAVSANVSIDLTTWPSSLPKDPAVNGTALSLYFMPASPGSASYSFVSDQTYSFRDPDVALPFGSFPGVGSYTA